MAQDVVCMRGRDAARMFYGEEHFTRNGAIPSSTLRLLQDEGSVQLLDGDEHRHRKAMFMSMMTNENIADLCRLVEEHWLGKLNDWGRRDEIVFFDEIRSVLTLAACEWIGLPTSDERFEETVDGIVSMLENAGSFGPANWHATSKRRKTEGWIARIVEAIRAGELVLPGRCPASIVCFHRGKQGEQLTVDEATVEIVNLLRPIVAIGRYVVFIVHALEENPETFDRSFLDEEQGREAFVEEVRRYYPFFPMIGGKALETFEWNGHRFDKGQWVILDIYGSNHDRRSFENPERFDPTRFLDGRSDDFGLIAQGGGQTDLTHRCPGERMTIEVMKTAIDILTTKMSYEMPKQDLTIDLSQMPASPPSGVKMRNIRAVG